MPNLTPSGSNREEQGCSDREKKTQPVAERLGDWEPMSRNPEAPTVQLTLFDLWEYTERGTQSGPFGQKEKVRSQVKGKERQEAGTGGYAESYG